MRVAIYARKSNDDSSKGQENKSVTRQVDSAKAYASKKGWTVDEEHIYIDDGISGAEYIKRPGLQRMLSELQQFDVVIASENSRIGREQYGNSYVFKQLNDSGVQLFFYLTDEELKFGTAIDQFMANVESFASQMERERIAQRTRDALERKARKGYSVGGRCYGYDNIWVGKDNAREVAIPKTKKSDDVHHTEQEINEDEARIVRGVFKMYAAGFGHAIIAKTLNGEAKRMNLSKEFFNGEHPNSPQNGTNSWAPSAIRAMLYRKRYSGIVEYGAVKNKSNKKPITKEIPALRIIDEVLWNKVQKRLMAVRETYIRDNNGNLWGRPETGRESKYLLSGLTRCGCCGGNITVVGGQKHKHYYYGCSYNQNRGENACANNHRVKMPELDNAVIDAIKQLLTPEALDYVTDKAIEIIKKRQVQKPSELPNLKKDMRRIERELVNLVNVIEGGGVSSTVLEAISKKEARLAELTAEVNSYTVPPLMDDLQLPRYRRLAHAKLKEFRGLLTTNVPKTRVVLRKLLRNTDGEFTPLQFDGVEFSGELAVGRLLYNVGAEKRT